MNGWKVRETRSGIELLLRSQQIIYASIVLVIDDLIYAGFALGWLPYMFIF